MALGAQLPVRLEDDVDARLESAARSIGTSKSAIIRLLAKTFVDQVVGKDGSVNLPPNWRELLAPSDGRALVMRDARNAAAHPNAKPVSYTKKANSKRAARGLSLARSAVAKGKTESPGAGPKPPTDGPSGGKP